MMLGLRAMVVFYLDKRGEEKTGQETKEEDNMIQH